MIVKWTDATKTTASGLMVEGEKYTLEADTANAYIKQGQAVKFQEVKAKKTKASEVTE